MSQQHAYRSLARRWPARILVGVLFMVVAAPVWAQAGPSIRVIESDDRFPEPQAVIEVRDAAGRPLMGLAPEQFAVMQDGRPVEPRSVQISTELMGQQGPTLAVVLDASTLLGADEVAAARAGAVTLLQTPPVTTTSDPEVVSLFVPSGTADQPSQVAAFREFTHDHNAVINYLNTQLQLQSDKTRLYAVVVEAVQAASQKAQARNTPAYVAIFSDGRDGLSADDFDRALTLAREANVALMTVSYGPEENKAGQDRLRRLAEATNGVYLQRPTAEQITTAYQQLAQNTPQVMYRVRFNSALPVDDEVHSWQVLVNLDGTELRSQQLLFRAALADQPVRPLGVVLQSYTLRAVPAAVVLSVVLTLLIGLGQRMGRQDSRKFQSGLSRARTEKGAGR